MRFVANSLLFNEGLKLKMAANHDCKKCSRYIMIYFETTSIAVNITKQQYKW